MAKVDKMKDKLLYKENTREGKEKGAGDYGKLSNSIFFNTV